MAIGPLTAHSEGLLSGAGVMAAGKSPSGGVSRARLREFLGGRCLCPSGAGGDGHGEGRCGLLGPIRGQRAGTELGCCCFRVLGPSWLREASSSPKHRRVHRCWSLLREMAGDPLLAGRIQRCLADPAVPGHAGI